MALAFLTRQQGVFVIPKASTAAHVLENARAGEFRLNAEEAARLDEAFPARQESSLPVI